MSWRRIDERRVELSCADRRIDKFIDSCHRNRFIYASEHALGVKSPSPDRIVSQTRYAHAHAEAEHLRCPEHFCVCGNVPGGTSTLADMFRGNKSASRYVPPEHFRAGTNPL